MRFRVKLCLLFGLPQDQIQQIGSITPATSARRGQIIWTNGPTVTSDVATKVLQNSQTMKFGFDFTRLYYLNDPIGVPNYSFYNIWDFLNDAWQAEGGPFQATTGFLRRLP